MSEIEKAIEELKDKNKSLRCLQYAWGEREIKRNELAISALEKQIPKKIVKNCNGKILHCPSWDEDLMGCIYSDYADGVSYCPYCGQAIDWDSEVLND